MAKISYKKIRECHIGRKSGTIISSQHIQELSASLYTDDKHIDMIDEITKNSIIEAAEISYKKIQN